MKNKVLLLIYLALCITELIAEYYQLQIIRYCVKPLLMIVLSVYFYAEAKTNYNSFAKKIQAALVFSFAGDVFLMFPALFLPGLIAFLIAHVFYILAFYSNIKEAKFQLSFGSCAVFVLPFLIYSGLLFAVVFPYLDKMVIPVAVYTVVITVMGISAVLRKGSVGSESYIYVLMGASFFILSDSTIAVGKFMYNGTLQFDRLIIMGTYVLAQYLIVKGCLSYLVSAKR